MQCIRKKSISKGVKRRLSDKEVLQKLDTIIKLLAFGLIKGKEAGEQILFLHKMGISNKDIAEILGKTQNTVNATLSQARKRKDEKTE